MEDQSKKLKPGSLLGSYRIKQLLGDGGFGQVFRGYDEIRRRRVVLKVISLKSADSHTAEAAKKFLAVGQALFRIHHPNLVDVYALSEEEDYSFVVMEHVEGKNFSKILKSDGVWTPANVFPFFKQVLEGVRALHEKGIVHQDLKLINIFLRRDGVVKLVDFGIGKVAGHERRGAIYYLAPEVLEGQAATKKSDIWSLGISFYEMLTGEKPFQSDDWAVAAQKIKEEPLTFSSKNQEDIPEELRRIILKMCEKSSLNRYGAVTEVLRDLQAADGGSTMKIEAKTVLVAPPPSVPDVPAPLRSPPVAKAPYLGLPLEPPPLGTSPSLRSSSGPRPRKTGGLSWVTGGLIFALLCGGVFLNSLSKDGQLSPNLTLAPETPAEGQKMVLSNSENLQFVWPRTLGQDTILQVSKVRNFQSVILEEPFPSSPYIAKKQIQEGSYYWRLIERNGDQIQAIFDPIAFTVVTLSAPSLMYPRTQTVMPEASVLQFYWLSKVGISHYRFQVAADPGFESLVKDILIEGIQAGPLELPPGNYYWRSRGEEPPSVTSLWSEVRTLRISKALASKEEKPVANPVQIDTTPESKTGSVAIVKPPIEKVERLEKAEQIERKISEKTALERYDDEKKRPKVEKKTKTKKLVKLDKPSRKVVKAKPVEKIIEKSLEKVLPPRKVASVQTSVVRPPEPVEKETRRDLIKLKLPPNGVSIVSLSGTQDPISFRWEEIADADSYLLEVAADANFKRIVLTMTAQENQYVVSKKLPTGQLFWRVRAVIGSSQTPWAKAFSFEISR